MGHPDRKLIRKHKVAQGSIDALDQFDLINTYRAFHPKTIDFTFSLKNEIDHILGHNQALVNLRKA